MEEQHLTTLVRLVLALIAGGLIGLERSMHGRPAGFRTHTLVCTASSCLMLLTVFQWEALINVPVETLRIDPTRMAQGIMTGIGFLGAGVIVKEGMAVRGLTTAASIWITAAIGILIGMGLYFAAGLTTLVCIGTLSLFRRVENILPNLHYAYLDIRFKREQQIPKEKITELVKSHGIHLTNCNYHLIEQGQFFLYKLTLQSRQLESYDRLATTLNNLPTVLEYSIESVGN